MVSKDKLVFALDYDHTFSADPIFWKLFIASAKSNGYDVYIVTMRHDNQEEGDEVRQAISGLIPIIFCNRRWKKKVVEEQGIKISIWIDDFPEAIGDQRELFIKEWKTGQVIHVWDWLDDK